MKKKMKDQGDNLINETNSSSNSIVFKEQYKKFLNVEKKEKTQRKSDNHSKKVHPYQNNIYEPQKSERSPIDKVKVKPIISPKQ